MRMLGDAAYRVLVLLAGALAPRFAPVDVVASQSALESWGRLAIVLALFSAAVVAIRKVTARQPGVAALAVLALIAVPVASAWFDGERGPLARGAWVVGPLVWAALAAVAAGPVTDLVAAGASRRVRAWVGVVVIGLGMASLEAGHLRFPSRESLWRSALSADPGNETAALAVAAADRDAHFPRAALDALLGCAHAHPTSCACAEGAASTAIDLGLYPDARKVLDASDVCPETAHRMGLEAESLVGTAGGVDDGLRQAGRALEHDADELHALFARAWGTTLKGRPVDALADAQRAVAMGRGIPAELLYGLVLFQNGDLTGADAQFLHVVAEDPSNVQATYDHALVADRQQRYHDAREGYLRTLALDPSNADARYNLVVLTHAHGATLEAQHDVDELASRHPNDARLPALRQLVATPIAAH